MYGAVAAVREVLPAMLGRGRCRPAGNAQPWPKRRSRRGRGHRPRRGLV